MWPAANRRWPAATAARAPPGRPAARPRRPEAKGPKAAMAPGRAAACGSPASRPGRRQACGNLPNCALLSPCARRRGWIDAKSRMRAVIFLPSCHPCAPTRGRDVPAELLFAVHIRLPKRGLAWVRAHGVPAWIVPAGEGDGPAPCRGGQRLGGLEDHQPEYRQERGQRRETQHEPGAEIPLELWR